MNKMISWSCCIHMLVNGKAAFTLTKYFQNSLCTFSDLKITQTLTFASKVFPEACWLSLIFSSFTNIDSYFLLIYPTKAELKNTNTSLFHNISSEIKLQCLWGPAARSFSLLWHAYPLWLTKETGRFPASLPQCKLDAEWTSQQRPRSQKKDNDHTF